MIILYTVENSESDSTFFFVSVSKHNQKHIFPPENYFQDSHTFNDLCLSVQIPVLFYKKQLCSQSKP